MTTTATTIDIPAALRPGRQWVCFSDNKTPISPYTLKGVTDDLVEGNKDWASLEEAYEKWKANSHWLKGIGREFIKSQGFTGVDLDYCINDQGELSPYASFVVRRLNSYTEYSPSRRGLHIWVYGTIPSNLGADIKSDGDDRLEMYDHERYFTITGQRLEGTPTTIEARQEQLTALYEEKRDARRLAKEPRRQRRASLTKVTQAFGCTPYGLKALEDEAGELASCGRGGRNQCLNNAAFNLGRLIAGNELTQNEVERALMDACQRNGLLHDDGERGVQATIRSGLSSGMQSPRSAPVKNTLPDPPVRTSNGSNGNGHYPSATTKEDDSSLPQLYLSGQLREKWNICLKALRQTEEKDPTIFVQSARLVQIGQDDKKHPIIMQLGIAELKNALSRSADYYRLKETSDEIIAIPISPPKEIAEAILALNPSEWKFPSLEAIVETPVIRPDGSILDKKGYDEATCLYYYPGVALRKLSPAAK